MRLPTCPVCRRALAPAGSPAFPFCSDRCRLIDLGRWLDEKQAIPKERSEEDEEDEAEAKPARDRDEDE